MLIGASAAHAGERTIWMRFAGALLQNVEQTEVIVDDMSGTTATATKSTVHVRTWGNLGFADITGFALEVPSREAPAPGAPCPGGNGKLADIVENNIVLTFTDLSLLYGTGSGALCLDFGTGEVFPVINGKWDGGTQRFRNASGHWSLSLDEAAQIGGAATLLAETGMLRGKLVR